MGGGRAPVRQTTADNYVAVAKGLAGWYVRVKRDGWDGVTPRDEERCTSTPESFSLHDIFPSAEAEGASLAIEYLQWLCEVRGIAPKTEDFQLRSLIAVAKWLHHGQRRGGGTASSRVLEGSGGAPNGSGNEGHALPPVVGELVRVQRATHQRANKAPRAADEAIKWLDWPQYLRLVETLKHECAPLTHKGSPRSEKDVAMAVQKYLLFAILACVPDRQRTLRELELNRTLFCEEYDEAVDESSWSAAVVSSSGPERRDGRQEAGEERRGHDGKDGTDDAGDSVRWVRRRRWVVRHSPEDYKTGGAYGARPALVLDPRLYPVGWRALYIYVYICIIFNPFLAFSVFHISF